MIITYYRIKYHNKGDIPNKYYIKGGLYIGSQLTEKVKQMKKTGLFDEIIPEKAWKHDTETGENKYY